MSCDSKSSNTYQEYLDQISNQATVATLKAYAVFGDYDYSNITKEEMINLLMKAKPATFRSAKSAVQALKRYLLYLNNEHALNVLSQIDASEFAKHVVNISPNPYVSEEDFQDIIDFIDMSDSPNTLYIRSFVRACFEGIYNEDMSVLMNLRARDIHGNIVTLRNLDGKSYDFEISHDLAFDLIDLAKENKWFRKNRLGTFSAIKMSGLEPDTCFKSKSYTDIDNIKKMQLSYWRITRTLSAEYGRKITPKMLFISGLICRIQKQAADFGLTMQDIFRDLNVGSVRREIIEQEFDRCRYFVEPIAFRETVEHALKADNDE